MSSWALHVSEFILCTIIIRAQVSSCENIEFGMCKYIMAILLTWTPLLYGELSKENISFFLVLLNCIIMYP